MLKAIREAGRIPVQRNTFYQPLKVWPNESAAALESAGSPQEILKENLATA
jgi:hypothetical protein